MENGGILDKGDSEIMVNDLTGNNKFGPWMLVKSKNDFLNSKTKGRILVDSIMKKDIITFMSLKILLKRGRSFGFRRILFWYKG